MRRACSSDVRSVSFLGRDGRRTVLRIGGAVYRRSRTSRGAIEPEAADLGSNGRGDEVVDRQPGGDPLANLRRGDGERRDREELDAIGPRQRARRRDRDRRGRCPGASPRRCARARARGRAASRSGRPRARRRRSGRRGRRGRAPRASRPCGANGSRETSASSRAANASSARVSLISGAVSTSLCPGSATTRTSSRSRRKWSTASRASATCPSWGGSKAPPRIPTVPAHSQIEDLVADLDLGARLARPAARSASSSSSPSGAVPTTRKP